MYADAHGFDLDAENVVVSAGGKTGIPTLYRIFKGLGIPTYVTWDGDRTTGEHGETNTHISAMLGVELDEFPDTTITESFAVWTDDLEAELCLQVADYRDLERCSPRNLRRRWQRSARAPLRDGDLRSRSCTCAADGGA